MKKRIAVVGSGISGLSVAHGLCKQADVVLFEADSRLGGHANTLEVTLEGITHGVDTGFLVYNDRTYPNLLRLFAELGVETAASDMSFSVQVPDMNLEWSGSDLNTVFAQRRNLVRPSFLRMLADILRFNRITTDVAQRQAENELDEPIGDFLRRHRFSTEFRDWYFLPMIGCIWSCPTHQMLQFPIATMIRFCHNHGLIQVNDRPQWRTVRGGSQRYVAKMARIIASHGGQIRLSTTVRGVSRPADEDQVILQLDSGPERFDDVVLAGHSDQSLALLQDATAQETAVLGDIAYHPNRAVLHTDRSVLPQRELAWAAWNYERAQHDSREQAQVCLHYLINKLQPLPWKQPVVVSLNPTREIRADQVIAEIDYAHPVFDRAAIAAQQRLPDIQGQHHTWFCGAWTRYGFHEDGLMSGLAVVKAIKARTLSADPGDVTPMAEAA